MVLKIRELEDYSSAVAHDIKSPLGIVEGYADQLHDYWDDFDEVSRKNYLKAIRRNSNKIAAIVDELLSFSSLSQAEIDMQPLNMGNIVNQATNRVGPWIHGFDGQIQTPDEWPIALGHPVLG